STLRPPRSRSGSGPGHVAHLCVDVVGSLSGSEGEQFRADVTLGLAPEPGTGLGMIDGTMTAAAGGNIAHGCTPLPAGRHRPREVCALWSGKRGVVVRQLPDVGIGQTSCHRGHDGAGANPALVVAQLLVDYGGVLSRKVRRIGIADAGRSVTHRAAQRQRSAVSNIVSGGRAEQLMVQHYAGGRLRR